MIQTGLLFLPRSGRRFFVVGVFEPASLIDYGLPESPNKLLAQSALFAAPGGTVQHDAYPVRLHGPKPCRTLVVSDGTANFEPLRHQVDQLIIDHVDLTTELVQR